jgi:hypothetical protein
VRCNAKRSGVLVFSLTNVHTPAHGTTARIVPSQVCMCEQHERAEREQQQQIPEAIHTMCLLGKTCAPFPMRKREREAPFC